MRLDKILLAGLVMLCSNVVLAQPKVVNDGLWHGEKRSIHYRPDGNDFVLVNGTKRFNRALYGTNTAFRVEAGDLPEFALYLPGMGGNLKFGFISGSTSKWIIDAKEIETRYRPGSMLYKIKDPILGVGVLNLSVLAQADGEGMIVKAEFSGTPNGVELFWAFGGATGKKFSRDGDIGADPESSFYLKPEYCKDNSFIIDKNAFKLSYGSGRVLTEAERYEIEQVPDNKEKGVIAVQKQLSGLFPLTAKLQIADAEKLQSPLSLAASVKSSSPVIAGRIAVSGTKNFYFLIQSPAEKPTITYSALPAMFIKAEAARSSLASRIKVNTPDAFINTLGGALGVAADGIWEDPTYLHGAIAWRMRLNAWRGASTADPLGWHDRAKRHFESYKNSQVLTPERGPVTPDTALNFARQQEKMGTALFSSGYISRNPNNNTIAHHYDMNLVFFDQMLSHINWTGDLTFAKEMWPAIKRHMAWEKRNFDMDGDGLYDAYATIWASDALQYSGGGVTHSSSYNYRSNTLAAKLAAIMGEDPSPYQNEADKILKAINTHLWLPQRGWFAEYKDLLGLKKVHPYGGLWTVYHAIDSKVPNPFQAYQALRYIDNEIPHIPIKANGLPDKGYYYTISTTKWHPYTWSLNNVALAEVLHTSLAYWQAGRSEDAFKLWESILIESMYLGSSPGSFEQLSFYDAMRGELYRDFADPIAMASRSLVEGLFGIKPDALNDTLTIQPGLPAAWDYASLNIPDLAFDFKRTGRTDTYSISPAFPKSMNLRLVLKAKSDSIKSITINGESVSWSNLGSSVGNAEFEVLSGKAAKYDIVIEWEGNPMVTQATQVYAAGSPVNLNFQNANVLEIYDPQAVLVDANTDSSAIYGTATKITGNKTLFAKMNQGGFSWWMPVNFTVAEAVAIIAEQDQTQKGISITLKNPGDAITGKLLVNKGRKAFSKTVSLPAASSIDVQIPESAIAMGTNLVRFEYDNHAVEKNIINWTVKPNEKLEWQKVDLSSVHNDLVTNIFQNKYLSPRPSSPTLQLPLQGIGNWCYPLINVTLDDSGLRKAAMSRNEFVLPNGVPFQTPSEIRKRNIVYTSQWDNYPDSVRVPLTGKYSHAYLLMAGSTNGMQSRFDNGEIQIYYTDGTSEKLVLRNPETWWPIEQDFYTDDYAFNIGYPRPYRVSLKTAEVSRSFTKFYTIKGFSSFGIDGGAATVLDLPLNPDKELKELRLKTLANDVVIGLMSVTLKK